MKTLLAVLAVLASALVLSACAGQPSGQKAAGSHACADKIAQATTTTAPVIGLWSCLSQSFQNTLKEVGALADSTKSPDAVLSIGVAQTATLIGADSNYATYDLVLTPSAQSSAGVKNVEITVWLNSSGLVDNVGVATPAF